MTLHPPPLGASPLVVGVNDDGNLVYTNGEVREPVKLVGPKAEVSFQVSITRKDTGKVETYDLKGYTNLSEQELREQLK
jgi:hypothetical protein